MVTHYLSTCCIVTDMHLAATCSPVEVCMARLGHALASEPLARAPVIFAHRAHASSLSGAMEWSAANFVRAMSHWICA